MRVLHVTFRYGKDVYGGAEHHLAKITGELVKRGLEIDVCTTMTQTLKPFIKSGVMWDNIQVNESIGGARVLRFPSRNPNRYLSLIFEKLIQSQLDKEESASWNYLVEISRRSYQEKNGLFLSDWNNIERYGTFEMRWTKKNAKILINDANVKKIKFSAMNRNKIDGILNITSRNYEASIKLPKSEKWEDVVVELPGISGKILLNFELDRIWRPLKDHRTLGIAVSGVSYVTESYERTLEMENDYRKFLRIQGQYVDYLYVNASKRPKIFSNFFDYLRGPDSRQMIEWLDKNAKNYDVIMAQMFPFNTVKYALRAKKLGIPIVLMPLMHIDDDFYHWRHYYDYLKQANMILAISEYSKVNLFDKIGANSEHVGAGIDKNLFLSDRIDGEKFKEKYGLDGKIIILTVSRKSRSKRYDLLIEAVMKVKNNFKNAQLVMIGPEEDGWPVDSKQMSYLGKVSEEDLLNAYDACDVFAMMSDSESFGMVFCEAWSRKKPVIGNIYCGAVGSLIENGRDGFLCKDAEEISEKIKWLIDNKNLAQKMGQNGFKKVIDNYTWDRVADRVYKTYNELI